jgi:protein-S-isoprenylcysteine O-methyltransferase Ste14
MKLGIVMLVIGFAGMLLMFLPAVEISNIDIYTNPWITVIGIVFFIMFLFGLYRFRKEMRRRGEDRYRRK